MGRTCIKNADWIVAWDKAGGRHTYLTGGDLVFSGDKIEFVGRDYKGQADETIDGRGLMVMPGLINIHSHPATEPFFRGIREEHGVPNMYMTGLYDRYNAFTPEKSSRHYAAEVAYSEMLLSGITAVADLSEPYPEWIELAGRSGLRVFMAPGFASARWQLENDWQLKYKWDEAAGKQSFRAALDFIDQASRHNSGRLSGVLFPRQIDTCSAELLRESYDAAVDKKLPFTTHCAQSVLEFNEMVNRHGKTPIQWAKEIGVLGPRTTLGHAIFVDDHSWLHWHTRLDVKLLAETGATVAHCPSPFARYGQAMEDFGRYCREGVNMGFGTDVSPHNLIEEMRLGGTLARVAAEDINTTSTAALFHAGTVGGATAMGRDDLGRLAPGMKADLVLVDCRNRYMMPARDPLRSLIYTAADRAVRDVYVDGLKMVDNGQVVNLNHAAALEALVDAQARMEKDTPNRDFGKRTAEQVVPLSLPRMN
jgi:cytosine/adenosine deaminase-related metal-dependent hydrolase